MTEQDHWVYVIELAPEPWESQHVGVVYVGETALTPEERFAKHLSGARTAARVVTRRGRMLRAELAPPGQPFSSRDEALEWEQRTADELRDAGYRVYGGQGRAFMED
ncbi:GIY-YIG nuclease family protein [Microbacter sp. GSS18]|nr:GIY-YIG nuclease family protein [Microbacter sp. GSS18]